MNYRTDCITAEIPVTGSIKEVLIYVREMGGMIWNFPTRAVVLSNETLHIGIKDNSVYTYY